jgi:hypothetical protein
MVTSSTVKKIVPAWSFLGLRSTSRHCGAQQYGGHLSWHYDIKGTHCCSGPGSEDDATALK